MTAKGRFWVAVITGIGIFASIISIFIHAQNCSQNVEKVLQAFNGVALTVGAVLLLVTFFQCARCFCCLRAEPAILIVLSILVLAITAYMTTNHQCDFNSNWLFVAISVFLLSVVNAILSWCF